MSFVKTGSLKKTEKFLDDIIFYRNNLNAKKKFKIIVNYVLQKANHTELESMLQFAKQKNVKLYIIPMVGPIKLSIYDMTYDEKLLVLANVKALALQYKDVSLNIEDVIADLTVHLANAAQKSALASSSSVAPSPSSKSRASPS